MQYLHLVKHNNDNKKKKRKKKKKKNAEVNCFNKLLF